MRINLVSTFSLIVSGALFIGCGDDGGVTTTSATQAGSTGEGTGTTTGTTTGTPMTSTSTTDDTTGTPTTTDPGTSTTTSTTEPGTSTTSTTEPGTGTTDEPGTTGEPGSTGGTTGGEDVCAPAPGDDACVMCTKMDCCDELKDCLADEPCACFTECAQVNNPITCFGMCPGVDIMHPFLQCAQGCGCG
jgi:hypothetical protein